MRALEFFGGCPQLVVPDNTRTGVSRACRYEPDLNPTYQEMAMHYAVGVLPTRPRKPRDKAKVEVGVQIAERWIVAALRHRKFFSLGEMNRAIGELLDKLNQRPFKKREGSRRSLLEQLDRPALRRFRSSASIWPSGHTPRSTSTITSSSIGAFTVCLSADAANGGGAGHAHDRRDLHQRQACGLTRAHGQTIRSGE